MSDGRGTSSRSVVTDGAAAERGPVRVETNARVHFGFCNLSLAHDRLYGGIGAALAAPGATVDVSPATTVRAPDALRSPVERAVEDLSVPGAAVDLVAGLPRHVGLGSGTQHALAVHAGVAAANGLQPRPREAAPTLGRGGRSGVGVAAFEGGGVVVDAGHPAALFTPDPPPVGEWSVPAVLARHRPPEDWRLLLVTPDVEPGRSGTAEDTAVRSVVRDADPTVADRVAGVVTRRLLPAVLGGDLATFGEAIAEVGRHNGTWFADQQGGVYRPVVADVLESLTDADAVLGAGQSSWGPTAYGVTSATRATAARRAGERALDDAGVDGTARLVAFATGGATVRPADDERPAEERREQ